MKKTSKIILMSVLTIVACVSLISGATFALFTSESNVNIAVTSGKVDVQTSSAIKSAYSAAWDEASGSYTSVDADENEGVYTFANGGTASYADGTLTLERVTPGDGAVLSIEITNFSTVAVQYRIVMRTENGKLAEGLTASITSEDDLPTVYDGGNVKFTDWTPLAAADGSEGEKVAALELKIELPVDATDEYQDGETNIVFTVEAVQGNAQAVGLLALENTYYVSDDAGFAAVRDLVNSGADVDIVLASDIDLSDIQGDKWNAIGTSTNRFVGTFNGRNHSITGLTTNCLFNYIGAGATVENLSLDVRLVDTTLDTATGFGYAAYGSEVAVTTFRNITVTGEVKGANAYAGWFQTISSSYGRDDGTEKGTEILFENCVNELDVAGETKNHAAAFVGNNYSVSTTFRNCVNRGDVSLTNPSGDGVHVGAFVGYGQRSGDGNRNYYRITFEGCINEGNVTTRAARNKGKFHTGGFVGTMQNGSATFIDCVNSGDVSVTDAHSSSGTCTAGGFMGCDNVGGIVMTNCKNTGSITATVENTANTGCAPQVGGLIGGSTGGGTVVMTDCTSIGKITANPQGDNKYEGLLSGTKGGVTVTIKGTVWLLQDDITNGTLVPANKIAADSEYTLKEYVE